MDDTMIRAREAAWRAIGATLGDKAAPLDEAMNHVYERSGPAPGDRPFATQLAWGVMRHLLWLDHVLAQYLKSGLNQTAFDVLNMLRLGAYQILFINNVPVYASVSETVNLARRFLPRGSVGLVNAVLRRIAERRDDFRPERARRADFSSHVKFLSVRHSIPEWIVKRLIAMWGDVEAETFCAASNQEAPLTIRVNTARCSIAEFTQRLVALDIASATQRRFPEEAFDVSLSAPPRQCAAFRDGWVYAQDAAAQLVSYYVAPQPGDRIVDFCAAPGGKATHLAALGGPDCIVHAFDVESDRCALTRANAERLGLKNVIVERKTEAALQRLANTADRALVDAPCSGLGTLRRHPDIRWHRRPEQIASLARQQVAILREAARLVKSGGALVYSTCTIFPEENQDVVQAFLAEHPVWRLDDLRADPITAQFAPDGSAAFPPAFVQPLPHRHDADGFFIARLRRL